jgi:hypothetical protein
MMQPPTHRFWPFDVLPPEKRTEQHWNEIRFFETAYQEGFHPCECITGEYQAGSAQGRTGWLIYRGHLRRDGSRQWEVWLDDVAVGMTKVWVDDFEAAANSVLRWLRGQVITASLAPAAPHILKGPQFYPGEQEMTGKDVPVKVKSRPS